ncbi:retrovirus-related pol polyprotein from transposon TNT 1-94, partial [Tanacetum coccineum]
ELYTIQSPRVGQALLQQLVRTESRAEDTTEGRKQNRNNSKSWKIGDIKYKQNITCWNCNQKGHFQNQCSKLVASRGKEVNMTARDSDDALVCCIENTVEDRIMDSSASFHATYYKDELERFKLRSSKVRLADDKTLDIAGIRDVVLKTSFGTSWTLKVVKYIPSLKRRLISVGQLDEEVYHIGFRDQQWTDFASWQQLIRLYYRGKENGVNILKSIDEGPFLMGTFRETLAEGTEGALHLGPEHPRVYSDLSPEDKERYNADILATNILLQGLPKDIYTLINHYTDAKDIWDNVKMLLEGSELTKEDQESQLYDDFEHSDRKKEIPFMTTMSGLLISSMTRGTSR